MPYHYYWVWCSYLAELAVSPDYKKSEIGKKLIDLAKEKVGEQSMILLLSVPTAMNYYPKVGFTKEDRGFMIPGTKQKSNIFTSPWPTGMTKYSI